MLLNFRDLKIKYNMNITGIIHIGGHYGEEIPEYISNGINDILVFEPLSENFRVLSENVKNLSGNIHLFNVALGNSAGRTTMYVSDNEMQSSSILLPKVHLTHHPNVGFPTTEEVQVCFLDSYDTKGYNFINMDVQGYELEVLKGARGTLAHVDYVYCEVNRAEVYENNAYVEDLDDFLSQYNMVRVETDWAGEIWGDALYVRN
jgi:FkbM family methyltransferase